ncbi:MULTISPECIES: cupin domain-containing protein [unclassified Crossiella]|uniref:cupin domain-containing protein n=1 Tax=unclassified Crossiella TaxID=2620835 RepID=UPI001FFE3E60|nr:MULTISPECIES: cupin domain-containing protein [unclassified Crossiella]MCK2244774.1 cupin domain-containing protein [Crossiella sp. S99.2]MCK2258416.1 cupin domain-containing protein [Crossiella sp. S99.1]
MNTEHGHTLPNPGTSGPQPVIEVIGTVPGPPPIPAGAEAMALRITLPPGSPGAPPHRHAGPAYGYVVQGEIIFELEGEPERVIKAGEAFWEPGGDVIHYRGANNLPDTEAVFAVTLFCAPGRPILTLVSPEELAQRKHLRAPRP